MTLHLTPDMLAAAYEFVATLPPFDKWGLPSADNVEFMVTRDKTTFGQYGPGATVRHRIYISNATIGSPSRLVETMAHEMLHLRQAVRKTANKAQHNAEFIRLAEQICRLHGYDAKAFV